MAKRDESLPEIANVDHTALPTAAGGLGAIWSSTKHLERDSGLLRGGRALLSMNQPNGFDCPGCAWPEPSAKKRPHIEFCENGAKALAEEATSQRATPEVFATLTIADMRLLTDFELGQLGRITQPLVREGEHYVPIAWDEAFALIAEELHRVGPAGTAFYTSGRTSNEAAFLYQLVGRMFGTNNFPDCSNMCHESSGVALAEAIGVGKGTVSLEDFDHADLVLVIGQNPGTNHPRMLTTLREVARRGGTIVSINPLREVGLTKFQHPQKPLDLLGGTALAKLWVQVQIGGDQALLQAMGKAVLEAEDAAPGTVLDHAFLETYTEGFAAWAEHTRALAWPTLVASSGVDEAKLRELAALYIKSPAVITCWAMGLTQHKHSVVTIQEVANLMLLRGNIGRPGAGLCPVRGHSNVQGDRTMGIDHLPSDEFLDALGATFQFTPPRTHGLDTVATIHAMERGEVHAFVAMGGNFVSATPDTERTMRALDALALTVSVSTKVCRTHLYPGKRALILPCLGRSERDEQSAGLQFVTVEDSMSMVHRSQGVLAPASPHLRSEPAIIAGIGQALLGEVAPWQALAGDYDQIRERISEIVPGFESFNTRVRSPDGFQLPNVGRDRTFASIGGRARFISAAPPDLSLPPGRLRMMTIRSHDQYNTTIYGLDDRYRGIRNERRIIFVNPADLAERGLVEHEVVDLVSEWSDHERTADRFIVIPFDLPRGNCATYFPEANTLVPLGSVADRSNTPTSKSVVITLRPRPRR